MLKQWVDKWEPLAYRGMEGMVELFANAPRSMEARAVSANVWAAHHAFLDRCGLNGGEQAFVSAQNIDGHPSQDWEVTPMATEMRKSGIDVIGDMVAWGAHFCLFYETKQDLLEALISYCSSGVENKEYCLWIVADPLTIEEATDALKAAVTGLDGNSPVEILSASDFFLQGGTFDRKRVTDALFAKLADISAKGYSGVRLTGDTIWVTKRDWTPFCELEEGINEVIGDRRLAVLCSYSLEACGANEILDAVRTHQSALARRHGSWDVIKTAAVKRAKAEIKGLNEELEQRVAERTSELVKASVALRKTQSELARVARLTAMGELAASIAHEVNQPLTAMTNNGSACLRLLANRNLEPEVLRRALEGIVADGTRANAVVARIRAFIIRAPAEKNELDMNEVIEEVLALTGRELDENRVLLERQLTKELPLVLGDRVQLQQVLLNLIMNGIEAMTAVANRPRLLSVESRIDESRNVMVAVRDSGTGLGLEADRIFTPFFTTKADGMGMGLSISRSLVEGHGGRLWATPNSPHGAVVYFTLPLAPAPRSPWQK